MSLHSTSNKLIIIQPGEACFDKEPKQLKTLLGSCVAMTVWHSQHHVGGLCHFLIGKSQFNEKNSDNNYRYGENALRFLYQQMSQYPPIEGFEISLFGGSNMYTSARSPSIGEANINFAKNWLKQHGLSLIQEDVLGSVSRTLILDLSDGAITLKRNDSNDIEIEN